MTKLRDFRDGLVGPTLILFVICLVITVALSVVYNITDSVIAEGERQAAQEARQAVLPAADSFTEIDPSHLPDGVTAAFKADNGTGYVFTSQADGFGGPVVYMIGMDAQGAVTGIEVFSHEETPGLGTKVTAADYLGRYLGNVDPDSVDAISGATRTTNSLKTALRQAREAYEMLREVA